MAPVAACNRDRLESYMKQAADTILASFREADLDMHEHFLNPMYHYTRPSGERLEFAARVAETDELKAFYKELADEEKSHYRLAQADLEESCEQVDPDNPPEPVQRFHEYWQSLADAAMQMSQFWIDIMHEGFYGKSVSQA